MKKRFKQLLLDTSVHSCQKQKEIVYDVIVDWMGDYNQIDDITVFGFEY